KEELIKNQLEEIIEVESLPINIQNGKTYAINQSNPNSFSHGYFKYPCKFIPEIPKWALRKYVGNDKAIILDPFNGSGTTLLESILNGNYAYGVEIDSFAKLLTKVKTTLLESNEIQRLRKWLDELINKHEISYIDYKDVRIPKINNLYHWFSEKNVQKLGLIKNEISKLNNKKERDFLNVCLSSTIRKSSKADDVSPKPYVSNKIRKVAADPFKVFSSVVERYLTSMDDLTEYATYNRIGRAKLLEGDALNINTNIQFDIAITSPPYINAFDYGRTLRLENLWLDLESESSIREKKKEYVGTENINQNKDNLDFSILKLSSRLQKVYEEVEQIDKKRAIIIKKFFEDMKKNLIEVFGVLKKGGIYCIVIGNSNIRKVEIESWKIISDIAHAIGFTLNVTFSYIIKNHYLRIPRGQKGGKIKKDYVLVLQKPTEY